MCGHDWCSVRISKEITDFFSGKDEASQPVKTAAASPGVTVAGADILKTRGNLSQEDIHRLAHKGKKADCHSDIVKDETVAKLVQLNTLKAHGLVVNETVL
jgi:phosphomethylpyrimidine synthase